MIKGINSLENDLSILQLLEYYLDTLLLEISDEIKDCDILRDYTIQQYYNGKINNDLNSIDKINTFYNYKIIELILDVIDKNRIAKLSYEKIVFLYKKFKYIFDEYEFSNFSKKENLYQSKEKVEKTIIMLESLIKLKKK